jgi:hypothetical protein
VSPKSADAAATAVRRRRLSGISELEDPRADQCHAGFRNGRSGCAALRRGVRGPVRRDVRARLAASADGLTPTWPRASRLEGKATFFRNAPPKFASARKIRGICKCLRSVYLQVRGEAIVVFRPEFPSFSALPSIDRIGQCCPWKPTFGAPQGQSRGQYRCGIRFNQIIWAYEDAIRYRRREALQRRP